MDTGALKKFAQAARNQLMEQVRGKLGLVLAAGSPARREAPNAVRELEHAIANNGKDQVVEQVAYTWFNRFTALRFMDANGYTSIRVVSPADGQTRPELLAEALAGNVDDAVPPSVRTKVLALLDGRSASSDPQGEAYRLLLVATCNQWHEHMPFMFEKINDFTELLMPDDLLSQNSILAHTRNAMTDEACRDVEVIGWLYQFYISEKKDQVFAGLKKNQKLTAENIPAATQLFTPHWIVRYLVENTLGRLWLLNRPGSMIAERMNYYIAPDQPETDFLRIGNPKEIKVCDPACGSAHMLTYAFDLLYAIYEEEGFDPAEIPELILQNNLTGIEIDDRAGALAAFALSMKASARLGRRRFLRMTAKPNIVVLQNVSFTEAEISDVSKMVGNDLFTRDLHETLTQFEQAKNFGSLIVPKLRDPTETIRIVAAMDFGSDLLLKEIQGRLLTVLRMAEALSPHYHVVVANPPYAGAKGLNPILKTWVESQYPEAKTDLMACFMERAEQLTLGHSYWGMINLPGWLFSSTYKNLRKRLLEFSTICSLLHLGRGLFGPDFGAVAFVVGTRRTQASYRGLYRRLFDRHVEVRRPEEIEARFLDKSDRVYRATREEFEMIPGAPLAYWVSDQFRSVFTRFPPVSNEFVARQGLSTSSSPTFVRLWFEVQANRFALPGEGRTVNHKWFPYNKGGDFRKWAGNQEYVVNWEYHGKAIKARRPKSVVRNEKHYFSESVSWSDVTSAVNSFRRYGEGYIFANNAHSAFPTSNTPSTSLLALLNSKVVDGIVDAISPGMHFDVGYFQHIPFQAIDMSSTVDRLVSVAQSDWDAFETSWDFTTHPLLAHGRNATSLSESYAKLRVYWHDLVEEMQRLEEANNRVFIDAYGMQDELTTDVPIEDVTLNCNPTYRYNAKNAKSDLETRLCADTIAEFLHFSVGCMFGRYSLDKPGLVLANQGEVLEDYLASVPSPTFMPDKDNVIPVLDDEWFADDLTERFRKFLRVTFGDEKYRENLAFIEKAIGRDIRKWFKRDFFDYHVNRFKNRPIYWLFSSPKGTFNALMYVHRYRPETVSVLLNDYLREYIRKLEGHRSSLEKLADDPSTPAAKATEARKGVITVSQQVEELKDWERDVVFPLAQQRIEIDLDDGVKANYPKFGAALRTIKALEASDE